MNVPDSARPTVGILGGMGPAATVDLMQRIINLTPARDDQDHLRLLVDNNPQVPSRIAALIDGTGASPVPALRAMAEGLQRAGADFLAMPCNTAHHYHAAVAEAVPIPFLDLRTIVARRVCAAGVTRVGLLASSALGLIQLYEPFFDEHGLSLVYPPQALQDELMVLIRAVKTGTQKALGDAGLQRAADALVDAGADALLIACTELSALGAGPAVPIPVFDAADLLAQAVVDHARERTQA
jgi:aspartate racemase